MLDLFWQRLDMPVFRAWILRDWVNERSVRRAVQHLQTRLLSRVVAVSWESGMEA